MLTIQQGQFHRLLKVQEAPVINLRLWRNSLPEVMLWNDNDPPSRDINVALIRAKYYAACYIIYQPLLYHALHIAGRPTEVESHAAPDLTASRPLQESPTNSVSGWACYTYHELPLCIQRACKMCIDSAILSTNVFDGIEGRPVVTNIFGTAHAYVSTNFGDVDWLTLCRQFRNMLVLSATYMSNLSELVDRNILERLLKRTILFLLQSQNISPSLLVDDLRKDFLSHHSVDRSLLFSSSLLNI